MITKRKVLFAIWEAPRLEKDASGRVVTVGGKWGAVTNRGVFHQWGTVSEQLTSDVAMVDTMAIVEDQKGLVHMVIPSKIKFVS